MMLENEEYNANIFLKACPLKFFFLAFRSYINQREVIAPMLNPMYEMNVSAIWPSFSSQSLVSMKKYHYY